ncbi:MAG TPA: ABC transporter permease, partial [Stellaceae bacterium]|nr:ABC transporter permease [Stellaceae bacterium]
MAAVQDRGGRRSGWVLLGQTVPSATVVIVFVLVPLLVLVRISLYATDQSFTGAHGWSLRQYARFLGDPLYVRVFGETMLYGLIVAAATLVIGFPVGYSLARMGAAARRWRMILVILPLTLSLVVNVFGWLVILGGSGLVNNLLLGVG